MPKELLYTLKKVWVSGQQLKIALDGKDKKPRGSDKPKSANRSDNKAKERKTENRPLGKLKLKSRKKISRRK